MAAATQPRALGLANGRGPRRTRRAALRNAPRAADTYDLVFLDPPYRRAPELGRELSAALAPLLAGGARVVTESDRRAPLELDLPLIHERRYGDTLHPHPPHGPDPRIAVCPGSYDPITNGHLDVIARAAELFDEVVVASSTIRCARASTLFTTEERIGFIDEATADIANVRVEPFDDLIVDFAREIGPARSSRACARSRTSSTRWR